MPLWLRLLGMAVYLAPLMVALVGFGRLSEEARGEAGLLVILLSGIIVPLLVLSLAEPLCWGLGWRPGALVCCICAVVLGVVLLFGTAWPVGVALLSHLLLLSLLLWEWWTARRPRSLI